METIYLYDAMFNTKKECSREYLVCLFKVTKREIQNCLETQKSLRGNRWFIIDDSTKTESIRRHHSNITLPYEAWKEIEGTNGEYFISSYGRVKDLSNYFYLSYQKNLKDGSKSKRYVKVKVAGKIKEYAVSRLVAFHFVLASNRLSFTDFKYYNVKHKNDFIHDDYFGNLAVTKPINITSTTKS